MGKTLEVVLSILTVLLVLYGVFKILEITGLLDSLIHVIM